MSHRILPGLLLALVLASRVSRADRIAGIYPVLLAAGAVKDVAGNPNAPLTNAGNVFVSYGPPTLITLDGRFDPSEWPACAVAVADSFDSVWNPPAETTNEIQALYATWDSTYLYLGIRGEDIARQRLHVRQRRIAQEHREHAAVDRQWHRARRFRAVRAGAIIGPERQPTRLGDQDELELPGPREIGPGHLHTSLVARHKRDCGLESWLADSDKRNRHLPSRQAKAGMAPQCYGLINLRLSEIA